MRLTTAERHDVVTTIRAEAQRVQQGVRDEAWDVIVALDREHGQKLYVYALRLGVDASRAADLVQEALLRLWRELGRGTTIASREAWTYRALSRLAMDEHRLHRRIAGLVTRLSERTVHAVMEIDATERVAIWAQVDRLPGRQRQVVYLRYQADLSFEEIGQVMGIEPGAARSYATAAHRTLRSKLTDGAGR
jgi:RNA polymerase sigma factor (sigma-70 family)